MPKNLMIKCKKCGDWFESPIQINEESFKSSTLSNNTMQCPRCGSMNLTDKKDMKFI